MHSQADGYIMGLGWMCEETAFVQSDLEYTYLAMWFAEVLRGLFQPVNSAKAVTVIYTPRET